MTQTKHEITAKSMNLSLDEYMDYQSCRIEALVKALNDSTQLMEDVSIACTTKLNSIKVIISDTNFQKPISNLEKKY
jgi:hypothetical protein